MFRLAVIRRAHGSEPAPCVMRQSGHKPGYRLSVYVSMAHFDRELEKVPLLKW